MPDNEDFERLKLAHDQHERNRQVLFGNEQFALAALQTIGAATAFGIVNQFDTLQKVVGQLPIVVSFTLVVAALAAAVVAALFRHEYKKWDVKAAATGDPGERANRADRAGSYLQWMRRLMVAATWIIVAALAVLVVAMWSRLLS